MPATAIDLGTYAVKAVVAEPGLKPVITRAIEILNPTTVAIPTDDLQAQQLTELIQTIFADNKLPKNDLRLSLPESIVSTKVITIPPLTDAELASAIGWQAEQHIPIPKDELSLQYRVLYRPAKNDKQGLMRVLLTGTRKPLVERYVGIFTNLGLEPVFLETHVLSVLRSLAINRTEPPTLVVNIGATNMDVTVVADGEILFVFTHIGAGALLTKTLQQALGLDLQQAEQYKQTYGLDPNQLEGKVRAALLPTIDTMSAEIQKAIRYFASQSTTNSIQRLVLTGGTSQLPGLVEHFTAALGTEVMLAAPFAAATGDIPVQNHQPFSVCMGLIARER